MNRVVEIRKAIAGALLAVYPRVHFDAAPDNATYPYLVIDLPYSMDDGSLEQFVFDLDGWDKSTDTTALEAMMYTADQTLHRKKIVVGDIAFTIYRDRRLNPDEKEKRLRRRKYVYQIRTYEG